MKHLFFSLLLMLAMANVCAAPAKNQQSLDRIIAVVNDAVITQSELDHEMELAKQQLHASNTAFPPEDVFHKEVIDQLINRKLQLQFAELNHIRVKDDELNKAISNIADQYHIPVKELYDKVVEQGMTKESYRTMLRQQILVQHVQQQEVAAKITITPEEVDDYMRSKAWQAYNNKEYHLEDVLIALPESPSANDMAAAKKHAESLLEKLHHGESFATVSASTADNTVQGGDLGWRKVSEIPTVYVDQLIHLNQNDLLGPILTANGYHIVRLSGVRNASGKHLDLATQKKQVQELIFQRKINDAMQAWITKLRSAAFINLHPEG